MLKESYLKEAVTWVATSFKLGNIQTIKGQTVDVEKGIEGGWKHRSEF